MTKFTEIIEGCKTDPNRAIQWTPTRSGCGSLEVHTGKGVTKYDVAEFPTAWDGRAVRLTKANGEAYNVFVANAQDHECDCPGFAYGRGKPCRHVEAVRGLLANNWLDMEANVPADPWPWPEQLEEATF